MMNYSAETEKICEAWNAERLKHPFFGENKSEAEIRSMWDASAEKYSDKGYGQVKTQIIDFLLSEYDLHDLTMIDIGCGPGTYAIPLSSHVGSILCVDSSTKMLDRLRESISRDKITNIECAEQDCAAMPASFRRDVSFSSLCPPMNCPEAILDMERFSNKLCVYISSANISGSIETDIWKRLGKDYSYGGYHTRYPYEFLRSVGRDPSIHYFSQLFETTVSYDECVDTNMRFIGKYRAVTDEIAKIVKDVVSRYATGDIVHTERTMTKGLLTWSPR